MKVFEKEESTIYQSDFAKCWFKLTKDYKIYMEQALAPSLTEAQLVVLEMLNDHNRMKPSDLIPYLSTTPAAVTMLLDRMEKNELIRRERDQVDRRIVWVSLSPKGIEETKRGLMIRHHFMDDLLGQISKHNQQLLIYLLSKLSGVSREREEELISS